MKFIGNRKNVHFMKMFLCIAAVLIIISLIACVAYQTTYKDKTDYILSQRRVLFVAKNALNLKKDISIVVESIKRNSNVNVFAIMSKISNSYDELRDAYEELIFCADKKFLVAKEGVLTVEETKNKTILNFYYPIGLESEIIENVIAGEKEKTFLLLKRLLDNNEKSFAASEDNLQNFQYSMLVTVERILQKTNKKREDIPQLKDSLEKLFSSTSKDEISFRIKQIFGLLFEEIDNIEKILKKGIHEEIYNYINEKYCEDISMTDISLKFNVSISFISKALKEKYNINFKSYINDLRVMKAVEIMDENPKVKIKELSQRVGFNSSTSFIRVFQRIQGITPKQYIEAKINKNK